MTFTTKLIGAPFNVVPSFRTGRPVGKGGHNSDQALVASRFL
jgi:hypothetical protein